MANKEWKELSSEEKCAIRYEILQKPKDEHFKECKKKPIAYRRAKVEKLDKLIADSINGGFVARAEEYNITRNFWIDTLPKKDKPEIIEDMETHKVELELAEEDEEIDLIF